VAFVPEMAAPEPAAEEIAAVAESEAMKFTEVEGAVKEPDGAQPETMEFVTSEAPQPAEKGTIAQPATAPSGQWMIPIVTFVPWTGQQAVPTGAGPAQPLSVVLPEGWTPQGPLPSSAPAPATDQAAEMASSPTADQAVSAEEVERLSRELIEKAVREMFPKLAESFIKEYRELIEKIAWDVVPELAETIIREEAKKNKG